MAVVTMEVEVDGRTVGVTVPARNAGPWANSPEVVSALIDEAVARIRAALGDLQ